MSTKTVEPRGTRLLSFWEPPDEAGPPIGCVASTYTFDGPFFEEHCLGRFAGIESDPNEDRRAYLIEREEKLAQVYSCVLVDRAHVTPHRSLRWNLLPVSVPGGGIQHSKLALLVWERHVRLLVGSANLTEPGYRSNYEQMAALDFTPEGDLPRGLLEDAIAHLERTRSFVPEGVQRTAHPGQALREFLRRASRHVSSWADRGWAPGAVRAELLCVHPGSKSLLDQLAERTWSGTGADIVHAMSPFFDLGTGARTLLTKLLRIMSVQGERRIEFFVGGRRLPDGALELDAPESIREPAGKSVEHVFHLVHARDELGEPRALHAKSLWLQRGDRAVCAVGSSNFTTAGTGAGGGATNLEANVAYVLPPASRNAEWKSIAASWPEDDELDLARQDVRFQREPQDRTPEPCEFDALPLAFGLAVFTFFALTIVGSYGLKFAGVELKESGIGMVLFGAGLQLGTVALVASFARRLDPDGLRSLGLRKGGAPQSAALGFLAYLATVPAIVGAGLLSTWLWGVLGFEARQQDVLRLVLDLAGLERVTFLVLAVLVIPLLEELFFRAFLQPLLVQNLGDRGGVAVTAVLFAAVHGNLFAFLPIFVLALAMGMVMLRTQRLVACYVVHALHNGLMLFLVLQTDFGRQLAG
ncbi:MAG: CPBP family intramembrane metalloprotease [Planctomycetaceae bacterium]|nr:CPBP family intramembrane metalloprotease [Planctomycetaceae bacterium]